MDWSLIGRGLGRYTVVGAGLTTVAVLLLTDGGMVPFALFLGGLVLVALSIGASEVRPPEASEGGHLEGSVDFESFPEENPNERRNLKIDRIAVFYGLGLTLFGGVAFSMGSSLPL